MPNLFLYFGLSADPCQSAKCAHGEVCVVDGNRARCLCPPRCVDKSVKRVCGTDGITYKNLCELMRTACIIGDTKLTKKQDGRCGSKPPTQSPQSTPSASQPPPTTGNLWLSFLVARETVSLLCRAALWVCFGDATAVRGCMRLKLGQNSSQKTAPYSTKWRNVDPVPCTHLIWSSTPSPFVVDCANILKIFLLWCIFMPMVRRVVCRIAIAGKGWPKNLYEQAGPVKCSQKLSKNVYPGICSP